MKISSEMSHFVMEDKEDGEKMLVLHGETVWDSAMVGFGVNMNDDEPNVGLLNALVNFVTRHVGEWEPYLTSLCAFVNPSKSKTHSVYDDEYDDDCYDDIVPASMHENAIRRLVEENDAGAARGLAHDIRADTNWGVNDTHYLCAFYGYFHALMDNKAEKSFQQCLDEVKEGAATCDWNISREIEPFPV